MSIKNSSMMDFYKVEQAGRKQQKIGHIANLPHNKHKVDWLVENLSILLCYMGKMTVYLKTKDVLVFGACSNASGSFTRKQGFGLIFGTPLHSFSIPK